APEMMLCSLPMTRLSATAELFGWLKLMVSFGAIENVCQLMMVDCDDWLTLVVDPLWEMVADPAATCPPVGPARAGRWRTSSAATAVSVANGPCKSRRRLDAETGDDNPAAGIAGRRAAEPRNANITHSPTPPRPPARPLVSRLYFSGYNAKK